MFNCHSVPLFGEITSGIKCSDLYSVFVWKICIATKIFSSHSHLTLLINCCIVAKKNCHYLSYLNSTLTYIGKPFSCRHLSSYRKYDSPLCFWAPLKAFFISTFPAYTEFNSLFNVKNHPISSKSSYRQVISVMFVNLTKFPFSICRHTSRYKYSFI